MLLFWHWSFGHTVLGIDFTARVVHPDKLLLVYVPHPGSNAYVPECFPGVTLVRYGDAANSPARGQAAESALRFALSIMRRFAPIRVLDFRDTYKSHSIASAPLLMGDEQRGILVPAGTDSTGYVQVLRNGKGLNPAMRDVRIQECVNAISNRFPHFFDRPFVTLLLREKGRAGDFTTASRCSGPQENYRPTVEYLSAAGYNIVGRGETDHSVFSDLPGYFDLSSSGLDPELLDVFCLTQCRLFIGQQSGPHVLPNACGILCVLADAWPHRLGTFREEDILVFKRIRLTAANGAIPLPELYRNHADLAYGYHYREKNAVIEPSAPTEILDAVTEAVGLLQGHLHYSADDKALFEAFRQLPSEGMTIRYQRNTPSLTALRAVRDSLVPGN